MLLRQFSRIHLLLCLVACVSYAVHASTILLPVDPSVQILFDETLFLSAKGGLPTSKVMIRGHKTHVVVDTAGSGYPMLTEAFAKRAKILAPQTRIPPAIFLKKPLRLNFKTLNVSFEQVGVVKVPDNWFEVQKIAGLFNPLLAVRAIRPENRDVEVLILDFPQRRFYGLRAKTVAAIHSYLDNLYRNKQKVLTPLLEENYVKLLVKGNVLGQGKVPILIDTGANSSGFHQDYLFNFPSVRQQRARNFAGEIFYEGETSPQFFFINDIAIGKVPLSIQAQDTSVKPVNASEEKPYTGVLGMDLLKECALVIAHPQTVTLYCESNPNIAGLL